ncbi:hypothetical protein KK062_11200 [Fulvivirgaceae bacterium PWU5]|uniref:PKD domain-containing protein n=1 Tax=Dawidia cretensis TaxID=2782350 RepID=A0AAP2GUE7_9BACT|nr:hypothetical protein [Dawidia cretensis]MBT1708795.1 hypothetical protein [Dawidia cretensis]
MKKIQTILYVLLGILLLATSCQDDDYSLGGKLDKTQVTFDVKQALNIDPGGNTVILTNSTPGTISMWDYQTGKSTRAVDTVHYPFKGSYTIKFSVLTAGGLVEVDSKTVEVTEDNLAYVNDPTWTLLSGGPGNEKSWVLDTDAKFFPGPISFYDPANHATLWWAPGLTDVYPGVMLDGDYGVMTFDLKNGAGFHATKPMEGGVEENGTYVLDVATMMLTINDGTILRGYKPAKNGLTGISDWQHYVVLSLTEDVMQLGVLRDRDVDGEGPALVTYNFLSKEYSDNWVPSGPLPPDEGFDPKFASGELLMLLAGGPGQSQTWVLDAAGNPIDWIGKGRGWTVDHTSSRDWGWNDTWDDAVDGAWIRFERLGMKYSRYQDGTLTEGTFAIDEETNEITLTDGLLLQNAGSWMTPSATTLKVVKAFPGETAEKGIWFGTSYDVAKDEWFAFHYVIPE